MKGTIKKILIYTGILVPPVLFFVLFFMYSVNAPINDDYQAIMEFINKCISSDSYSEKIKLIFAQHNEHRIVYTRIWTILSYKININVNFTILSLIGNISLIGIAAIFYKRFLFLNKSLLLFIPISIFIFNFTSWENITFAMASLSNFTVYFFILVSLGFITSNTLQRKRNLFLAVLFFFLAVITQGGGLLLFPISIAVLLYKKEYKNLIIYSVSSALIIFFYFYDYNKPEQSIDFVTSIITYKGNILLFAFAFLGNAFNYYLIYTNTIDASILFTIGIGIFFFLLFGYITYTKYYKRNLFIYSIMLLILVSSFVTAISRVSFGIETAGASRYRINGIIFLITLYFWFIETYRMKKGITIGTLFISGVYFLFISINQYEYLNVRQKQTYTGIFFYNSVNADFLNGDKNLIAVYKGIIEESKKLDTYNFPNNKQLEFYFPYAIKKNIIFGESNNEGVTNNTESITKIDDSYLIEGWAFIDGENTNKQKVYIGLESNDSKSTFYLANRTQRFDLNPYFKKLNLTNGGYLARIKEKDIMVGENKISILIEVDGNIKIIETDKKIIK